MENAQSPYISENDGTIWVLNPPLPPSSLRPQNGLNLCQNKHRNKFIVVVELVGEKVEDEERTAKEKDGNSVAAEEVKKFGFPVFQINLDDNDDYAFEGAMAHLIEKKFGLATEMLGGKNIKRAR
eukprot:CAMPEP_0201508380 /NCGR_PEP_ID=MMETSP0161_2-20130828/1766_1 /ASSEMBLY_ACC=CAM_ASM_000251 /TAXON_ID=180227 /ORGANISM="Neoparamoeba aestuarina, Strain SoJaBio B1-5/56/2" /LENGTH=124 /DNA_ID=CAMNT_0047903027 /DNA_START=239 /DNA_END=613 /DNA_ORIENTATION=-